MQIDKASFALALATLGAGGAGGYFLRDRDILNQAARLGAPERQAASSSAPAQSDPEATRSSCDDALGAPGACPSALPAEEGGCGPLPTRRCEEWKRTMKPRVAERAVACFAALDPIERCDPGRVGLCAHEALSHACSAGDARATAGAPVDDEVDTRCAAIVLGCGAMSVAPTMSECRATLAGLTPIGRDRLVSCMRSHCGDKGLMGCEVSADAH
jgi:hypothetical protein